MVEREKLHAVLKLLNHPSLDGLDIVNQAYNLVESIIDSNPVESDGFKEWASKGVDWCESRLQDHDAVLIEILDMLIKREMEILAQEHLESFRSEMQIRATNLKARLVGEK